MSLQFVCGSSGSGKSHTLYQDIAKHAKENPEMPHIVLVPEQFTLSTQRSLVMLSPNRGIMNIEVLSFERLAWRVFDELGSDVRDVLEDTGKSLLLRRICDELYPKLAVLGGSIKKPGFIDELKSLLSEFGQYGISPDDLGDFLSVKNMSKSFYNRIEDLMVIYSAFSDALTGRYITAEQVLVRLEEILDQSEFLNGAYVVFDGYTGFTPVQNRVFAVMLSLAKRLRVAVTMDAADRDNRGDETGVFAMSHEFINSMVRIANNTGCRIDKPVILTETGGKRYSKGSDLVHLEAEIFRGNKRIASKGDIVLASFEDTEDEITYVMSKIRERINADKSLKYSDFAVLCADINDYRHMVEEAGASYEIPVFVDSKDQVMRSSFVELTEAIIHLFSSDFSYESVMRYLRCGFSPLDEERVDALDNYLVMTGIRGKKRMGRIFDRYAAGVTPEELVEINESRAMLMEVFEECGGMADKALVLEHTRRLYEIIKALGCNEKINNEIKLSEERGEFEEAQIQSQLYPKVMELFDKLVFLMGDVSVDIDEYEAIVSEGLKALKTGVIPPSCDSVTFGDMERTRIDEIDTLFLIGMSDARVPKRFDGGGLLLQSERERLFDNDIVLAPTDRQKAFYQRFYLYMAVCRPKSRLYLTYPLSMEDEQELRESYLISSVRDCFTDIEIKHISKEELNINAACENTLEGVLSDEIRKYMREESGENEERFIKLLAFLRVHDRKSYDRLYEAAGFRYEGSKLSRAVMDAIYSDELNISASRLERYARCAYSYYLSYILSLNERPVDQIGSSDMGNLYHEALERYSNKLKENKLGWKDISKEESDRLLEESVNETYLGLREVHMAESAREEYLLKRMKRTLRRTVGVLTDQVKRGSFEPENFEVSMSVILDTGEKDVRLGGKIDRLDTFETEDKVYIKIIDYKSGSYDTDISEAYDGLQLQLFLYADAAKEAFGKRFPEKEAQSAAVFYYQVRDPMVETENDISDGELEELVTRELRVRGLVCDEKEVVEALDKGFEEAVLEKRRYASAVIPVEIKRDGYYSATSHVIGKDDFEVLGSFAKKKARAIADDISKGLISINPYRKADQTSGCDYCPYHSVCGFDSRISGFEHRQLLEEKNESVVIGMMKKEIGEADEVDRGSKKGN